MIKLAKAENRILYETNHLRISSFLKEDLNDKILFMDDVALNSKGIYTKKIEKSGYLLLLPLLNDIRIDIFGFKWKIETNQVFVQFLQEGTEIMIDGVNGTDFSCFYTMFLHQDYAPLDKSLLPIELNRDNFLKKIIRHSLLNVYLGKYGLSKKDNLPLKPKDRNWIVLSLTGVFEIYERLIESRDILYLNTNEYIDFESLSTDSLILIFEY